MILACGQCGGVIELAVATGGAGLTAILVCMWDRLRMWRRK